ncbi:MAG: hypothetical protein WCS27_05050 [Victivallaceae bacterium]
MKYSRTGSRRSSLLRDKDVRRAESPGHTERKGRGARPHSRLLVGERSNGKPERTPKGCRSPKSLPAQKKYVY